MHPGDAEGLTTDEIAKRWGSLSYSAIPGAESYEEWLPRFADGLDSIVERHRGDTIVCVTHSAAVKACFELLGRMPRPEATSTAVVGNTAVTEWVVGEVGPWGTGTDATWSLVRHNETAHLLRTLPVSAAGNEVAP
jgi:broad specificity phosphatase PhoE